MQRRFRLTRSEDITRVRKSGKAYAHPFMVLRAEANDQAKVRVAVVAGKSVGGAVERNRAKRLLRAAMQTLIASIHVGDAGHPGWDLILIARAPLVKSDMYEVREVLLTLLRRAELIPSS